MPDIYGQPLFNFMGVRRGGQEGALALLGGQNSLFFDFFLRKILHFFGVF